MKSRQGHATDFRVPLSREALSVIELAKPFARDGYLFPSVRKGVISDATMSRLMERRGMTARPHGFRSSFRTWVPYVTNRTAGTNARRLPAIIAMIEGAKNCAVHRTYVRGDGSGKADVSPVKAMLGCTRGGAVRLSGDPGPLVVAEGIETALSLLSGLLGKPASVWAALGAGGMKALRLPKRPGKLVIASDGDLNRMISFQGPCDGTSPSIGKDSIRPQDWYLYRRSTIDISAIDDDGDSGMTMLDRSAANEAVSDADAIAGVAKALAHPARVRIVAFLMSRPGCIGGDIVDEVGLAQSTVSEHLRILKGSGLVVGEIERPRICYSLAPAALAPLHALIGRIETRVGPQGATPSCYTPENRKTEESDA